MAEADFTATPATIPFVTKEVTFLSGSPEGRDLFSVRPGIPVLDATNMSSMLMSAAISAAIDRSTDVESNGTWSVIYTLEMAKAALDSSIDAITKGQIARMKSPHLNPTSS